MREIECYFDGVCEPKNPGGHGAYGTTINFNDGTPIFCEGKYIGSGKNVSNNVAEYMGFISILKFLQMYSKNDIHIRGDSNLVIQQMAGHWRIRKGIYLPYAFQAQKLFRKYKRTSLQWIPRGENDVCDKLAKDELRKRHIIFRIQPELLEAK